MSLGTAVYDLPGGDLLVRDQETGLSVIGSWHEVRRIGRSALEEMMRNRLQAEVANRASIDAERLRLATDSGIKSEMLEEIANGSLPPTRVSIQARHDELWAEARDTPGTR